jgi:hypothetical protein
MEKLLPLRDIKLRKNELSIILNKLNQVTRLRLGIEAFIEKSQGWIEDYRLLIRFELIHEEKYTKFLKIMEENGKSWTINFRGDSYFIIIS